MNFNTQTLKVLSFSSYTKIHFEFKRISSIKTTNRSSLLILREELLGENFEKFPTRIASACVMCTSCIGIECLWVQFAVAIKSSENVIISRCFPCSHYAGSGQIVNDCELWKFTSFLRSHSWRWPTLYYSAIVLKDLLSSFAPCSVNIVGWLMCSSPRFRCSRQS